MKRRLVGCMVLVAVFVSALPWEIGAAFQSGAEPELQLAGTSEPCSGQKPSSDLCNDGCLCSCCSAYTLRPPLPDPGLRAPPSEQGGALSAHVRHLHPREVLDRIFHPPRLG